MADATFVYDDDCGFCTWWAEWFEARTDLRVVGYSDLDEDLIGRLPADYETCSHLVTDGGVFSCGESFEQALLYTDLAPTVRPFLRFLRNFEDYDRYREEAYRWIADRRATWGQVLSSGRDEESRRG